MELHVLYNSWHILWYNWKPIPFIFLNDEGSWEIWCYKIYITPFPHELQNSRISIRFPLSLYCNMFEIHNLLYFTSLRLFKHVSISVLKSNWQNLISYG